LRNAELFCGATASALLDLGQKVCAEAAAT
jgi:hypothetical protein